MFSLAVSFSVNRQVFKDTLCLMFYLFSIHFILKMYMPQSNFRRPDYCLGPHLRQMLSYGCTRLEIGVQSTYEDVARDSNRGHTVAAVADCFCLAKDAGFKVHHLVRLLHFLELD